MKRLLDPSSCSLWRARPPVGPQAPAPVRTLDPGGLFLVAPAAFLYPVGPWRLASGPALGSYRVSGVGCALGTHGTQLVLRADMFKDT